MRVSRAQAAENRQRILDVAGRLFRERGIAATGVDAIMNAAGLTHGGFYSHFESKDSLAAEACAQSIARSVAKWTALAAGENPIKAIVENYLSERHRDERGDGCLIAAMLTEAPSCSALVRQVISEGIRSLLAVFESRATGRDKKTKRANALNQFSALIGALALARAVEDPALSKEFLAATAKSLAPAPFAD